MTHQTNGLFRELYLFEAAVTLKLEAIRATGADLNEAFAEGIHEVVRAAATLTAERRYMHALVVSQDSITASPIPQTPNELRSQAKRKATGGATAAEERPARGKKVKLAMLADSPKQKKWQ